MGLRHPVNWESLSDFGQWTFSKVSSHMVAKESERRLQCCLYHVNTLQHTASHFKHCNALHNTATHCNKLQHTATHCNALQRTATHCNTLQTECRQRCSRYRARTLQYTATHSKHCNTMQPHTVTHCKAKAGKTAVWSWESTLQHAATHAQCVAVCSSVLANLPMWEHVVVQLCTGWQKPIECLKLQVIFRKRATKYRALFRKMTCKDKASYGSSPPCNGECP